MSMDHSNAILICGGNISLALRENSVVTKVIAIVKLLGLLITIAIT